MSSLAFDLQSKPFSFQRSAKKLLARRFLNPSTRGTRCQVMNAEGRLLYIDLETDYVELRKALGHVPGVYRIDHCDENGVELDAFAPRSLVEKRARGVQSKAIRAQASCAKNR